MQPVLSLVENKENFQTDVHKTDMTFIFHLITSVNVNNTGHVGTNIIEMCLHTTVAVEKQYYIFQVYVCTLSYPACKAHVLYNIVIFGLSGCTIFSHIIS